MGNEEVVPVSDDPEPEADEQEQDGEGEGDDLLRCAVVEASLDGGQRGAERRGGGRRGACTAGGRAWHRGRRSG